LLRAGVWPCEQEDGEGEADAGEDGDGEEGGLEAFGEGDQPVGAGVGCGVVIGARDGHGGDDGDAERGSDLEVGVAESGGDPGVAFGDAGQRGDRGGDESQSDAGAEDDQPEEDVKK